jgi:hypothetical protein
MKTTKGAGTIEFLLGIVLVLLPLTFAILEFAQLTAARHALNFAAFEAARAGSVTGIDRGAMLTALARGLTPLFTGPADPGQGLLLPQPAAFARASAEVARPDLLRLRVDNPPAEAFDDFAVIDENGRRTIPNDALDSRNPWGPRSGMSLRDANVLSLHVRYCRRLVMPVTSQLLPVLLRPLVRDPGEALCLLEGRVPLVAVATLHMQSPARPP